jgi:tRNA U38,U39,U40 pseudouridine synthase TruA
MVGSVIEIMHFNLEDHFIENAYTDNNINIVIAPGEGLMLNRVRYDSYNDYKEERSRRDGTQKTLAD